MKLLWRLQSPVRSFYTPSKRRLGLRCSSTKTAEPLRILFCGSDEFSIASLRALHREHQRSPEVVKSIDVVCRPGKRTGRGLKTVREVPIKRVAEELRLPLHEIDTFTGWQPLTPHDEPINLVVAVSFGLLVPPRILNGTRYGGLNVHPSMLPDLRGPAPIHHTLLQRRKKTGITVQTLHPKHFDQGTILAQTPWPGLDMPDPDTCTPAELLETLAPLGGQMLVQSLRDRVFVPPLEDVGWQTRGEQFEGEIQHAPKITKQCRHIDWATWELDQILLRQRVLGDLWDVVDLSGCKHQGHSQGFRKRVILHHLEEVPEDLTRESVASTRPAGSMGTVHSKQSQDAWLTYATCDSPQKFLKIVRCTVEGGKRDKGVDELKSLF